MLALMMYLILISSLNVLNLSSSAWSKSVLHEEFSFYALIDCILCFMRHTIDFSKFFRFVLLLRGRGSSSQ